MASTQSGAVLDFVIGSFPEELSAGLQALAKSQRVTLAATVLCGWTVLLSRWFEGDDIVVEMLPVSIHDDPTVAELLQRLAAGCTGLLGYQQPASSVSFTASRAVGSESTEQRWTLTVEVDESGVVTTQLACSDASRQLETLERMAAGLQTLLAAVTVDIHQAVSALPIMSELEQHRVLHSFNETAREFPRDGLLHQLFEQQVERTPHAVALAFDTEVLTYAELNGKANQLARYLCDRGVGPDQPVAVCAERSLELVVGLLGVLKAGGCYLPLDPTYPHERLAYMLEDAQPRVLLTQARLRAALPATTAAVFNLDTDWQAVAGQANGNPESPRAAPDSLAYVIYTSGSTGVPKGVAAAHRGMVNRLIAQEVFAPFQPLDICCLKTSIGFVDAVFEIFGPLCNGLRLVIAPPQLSQDVRQLARLIDRRRITRLISVPSLARALISTSNARRALRSLRSWTLSGEELNGDLLHSMQRQLPKCTFVNLYGSSEVAADVTSHICDRAGGASVPIGTPIANTRIYILDHHMRPTPIGVPGEIYVCGMGLARGYLNRPDLTAERFISDPFAGDTHGRLYKSGDRGCWRHDGAIEYLGRGDRQLKLRGFRIELSEIEAQLARHPQVRDAVVTAREGSDGDKRLIAYVTYSERGQPRPEELRAHAKQGLPEYMVPSAFVVLQQLPLTPSGKLNRLALPAPTLEAYGTRQYEPPRDKREETLARIWCGVLGVERVGRQDNFFQLGGHSLLVVELLEQLHQAGLTVAVARVFQSETLADLAASLAGLADVAQLPLNLIPDGCASITPEMLTLVDLDASQIERVVRSVPGGASNIQDIYPLTPLQEGLLFHHLLDTTGPDTYVMSMLLSVSSAERLGELIEALQAVVDRHEILRTSFLWEGLQRSVQVVHREAKLPVLQMPGIEAAASGDIERWVDTSQPRMDLNRAPLMQLQVGPGDHDGRCHVLLQIHHIVNDDVSLKIIIDEIAAHSQRSQYRLAAPTPYRQHVAQTLQYAKTHDAEAFFRGKLATVEETVAPFGLVNVLTKNARFAEARRELDSHLVLNIREQARRLGVSAATLFHAALGLVVAHASGREDVVLGSVLLGRLHGIGAQRVVGMFINTLPLRLNLADIGARALVEHTQRELVELVQHEQASLAVAQRCSGVAGSAPLFSAVLNFRHEAFDIDAEWQRVAGIRGLALHERTNYPLAVSVDDLESTFALTAQTDRRVDPQRIVGYLETVLQSLTGTLADAPDRLALSLPVLPAPERDLLLRSFNATWQAYPREQSVSELFEEQVRRTPHARAVIDGEQVWTYSQLNSRANQLARHLGERGVEAGELVPILMLRSAQLVIAQLAVLKLAGSYVPIDPDLPVQRQAFMIGDCRARRVLLAKGERLRDEFGTLQAIDCDDPAIAQLPAHDAEVHRGTSHAAYVMYTSGSTGTPKGVLVPHRGVTRLALNNGYAQIGSSDCLSHCSNPAFDAATFEIWGALLNGASLVVIPQPTLLDPKAFAQRLQSANVSILWITTGLFVQYRDALAEVFSQLRYVLTGGDVLEPGAVRQVLRNGPPQHFLNCYGPTECTTFTTTERIESLGEDVNSIPIGRPIGNTQVYILDARRQPAPLGAAGEIYIGGDGVALGYLNRPELTDERFIPDPFNADRRARLYRSGDLGRWRADGSIEFLGRNDRQVKVRGFRIELGEIEAQLTRHSLVNEAAVVVRTDEPGSKRLVAYVASTEPLALSTEELRAHVRSALPEFMTPSAFVVLEKLPLTPNGKVDRRALPAPGIEAYASRAYQAPEGEAEQALAGIWQQLLRVERVGRQDNFFELGGHSLLIVQMMERLRALGLSTDVRSIYGSANLADLAQALAGDTERFTAPPNSIPPGCRKITPDMLPLVQLDAAQIELIVRAVPGGAENVQDIYPLAPLQEGIHFHHLLDAQGADTYVLPMLLSVASRQQLDRLIAALQWAIDRHDVLRTLVLWENLPRPVQVVCRQATLPVTSIEFDRDRDALEQARVWIEPDRQRMNLQQAPLLRLQVGDAMQDGRWYVLLQLHHLVCDHESLDTILAEALAFIEHGAEALAEPIPYREHVAQALAHASSNDAEAFFRGKLGDIDEPTAPFGQLDVLGHGKRIQHVERVLDVSTAARIRTQAKRNGVSAATFFHAAWALVVAYTSGRNDVVFGSVLLGRLQGSAGSQRTVGMYINTLPLCLRVKDISMQALVERAQREIVELLNHEQASLAMAQRCSAVAGSDPLFTALLNFRHSTADMAPQLAKAGVTLLSFQDLTNYPLALAVDDLGESFALWVDTDQRIDPQLVMDCVVTAIDSALDALEQAPQTAAKSLRILPLAQQRLVESFNAVPVPYPHEQPIHELFEAQVERSPEAVALAHEKGSLTYSALNARANQLAHYLQSRGVGPDRLVALCVERGPEMLVGLLGVLKAGGAYVPLDPNHPSERLAYMLEDAAPAVILTQQRLRTSLPATAAEVVALDADWQAIAEDCRHSTASKSARAQGHHLAYVIYTSGSTGRPKGVMIEHRNVLALWQGLECMYERCERIGLNASFTFDASVQQIVQLLSGRTLCIVPQEVRLDAAALLRFLRERSIHGIDCTPSQLKTWIAEGLLDGAAPQLRVVLVGGEPIDPALWARLANCSDIEFFNVYGPTEITVDCTSARLNGDATLPHIGQPMQNRRVYIVDAHGAPVPTGVAGEIVIAGAGIARGYLNRPELTRERFAADPFRQDDPHARCYKTGDVARWRADGRIEYLGRNDQQVKIRGYRIEVGEIEVLLARHPRVKEAAVVARDDASGVKRLIAYVTPRLHAEPSADDLRAHVSAAVPDYMVPSAFVVLQRMPVTPSGKLDRRALPEPDAASFVSREYQAPAGEVEEILAGIWQSLLKLPRVGRRDNFFELGGHSLLIVQMKERLRRFGLNAEVRSIYTSRTLADLARTLSSADAVVEAPPNLIPQGCGHITPEMLPLVELDATHIERIIARVPGGAGNVQDVYRLTALQEGMLFHHLLDEHKGDAYVETMLLSAPSQQRLQDLVAAWQGIIGRHDALRTAILWEDLPHAVQVVQRSAVLPVEELTLAADRDPVEQMKELMKAGSQRLDLRQAPLMRLKVAADPRNSTWYALLQTHHMVSDHESTEHMLAEMRAYLDGRQEQLPATAPFRNHVAQSQAQAKVMDAEAFFTSKLGDVDAPTAPFGLLNVHGDGSRIAEARRPLVAGLAARVRAQARNLGVSSATLFHAAWALVVSHTSGQDDVVFGTVLLGRLQGSSGGQRVLGMFMNTLPIRLRLQGVSAVQLIEQTQLEVVQLLNYEQASLAVAQRCSAVAGSTPLFSALLNFRHSAMDLEAELAGAGVELLAEQGVTNYPLMLSVDDVGEQFVLGADTDCSLDPHRIIEYMETATRALVEALEADPHAPAMALSILPDSEGSEVVVAFNATAAPSPREKLVHRLFEEQVRDTPASLAVVHQTESLTYAELNARANQLARHLQANGIGPSDLVAICIERGLDMVVGLLGILKAGAAYMPMDPNYPADRLRYMLEDGAPKVVLTQQKLVASLPATAAAVIAIDAQRGEIERLSIDDIEADGREPTSRSGVYVIYTSGSTGKPKGTLMEHGSMVNLIEWHRRSFGASIGKNVLQFAALSFDVAFQETFSTLCTGATLVLLDEWMRRDARALTQLLSDRAIHRLFLPPLMLQSVAESARTMSVIPENLEDVITAGEQLRITPEIVEFFKRLGRGRLHNHYGPTETHVVTALTLTGDPQRWPLLPSIGQPIANSQMYVLDAQRKPVPIGVAGELYIGGANVARGYLGRPELTAQRFVADPFSAEPDARLYRTGDLARWSADGALEYLGRNDDQVKIRGFRIELGEVEARLAGHANVKEVAVIVREDGGGGQRLVAYITKRTEPAPSVQELRAYAQAALPEHMLPGAFVVLDDMPVTPSGKLNRRALPAPEQSAYASREYQQPQGEIERTLAGIWQTLLRVERVGRQDNFFELGGHSLLIVQMMERLRQVGLFAKVRNVYDSPKLSALAEILAGETASDYQVPPNLIEPGCEHITPALLPLVQLEPEHIQRIVATVPGGAANVQDIYPLTALQEGMLFHHLLHEQGGDMYVVPILMALPTRQRLDRFIEALHEVVARHDILRTAILWKQLPQAVQVVYRNTAVPVQELVLDNSRDALQQMKELMSIERQRVDLQRAPMMQLQIAADPQGEGWYAFLQLHHMVCDHESIETTLAEVVAYLVGAADDLPASEPYRSHVAQALEHARKNDAAAFFRSKLGDVDEPTAPFGLLDVRGDGSATDRTDVPLEPEMAKRIRAQARRFGVSAATLFHAAWALVMARTTGRDDVVFGTVLLGRLQGSAGAQRTLGMFMNTLPLRVQLRGLAAKDLIAHTQRELVELLNYEQASLAVAQRCSGVSGTTPLFSALLNYRHNAPNLENEMADAGVNLVATESWTNFPVMLAVDDLGSDFSITSQTDRRIDPRTIEAYLRTALGALVTALEEAPQTPALALQVLPEVERHQLLATFNDTHADYPQGLIHELFEAQVSRTPEAMAIVCGEHSLTYAQLDARSTQLARHLRSKGIGPDKLVALCLERGIEMVIGLLGVLKAGGAYVPLDPAYPAERLAYMIDDAQPSVLLTQEALRELFSDTRCEIVALDSDWSRIATESTESLPPTARPRNLAYVIYTSGSTGNPKGVMVHHRAAVNFLTTMQSEPGIDAADRLLAVTTVSFDIAGLEIYLPLICGARLIVAGREAAADARLLMALIEQHEVTMLQATPVTWQLLLSAGWSGLPALKALCGGEALNTDLSGRLLGKVSSLWNLYGPTETTIWSCVRQVGASQQRAAVESIGHPIANTQIYVLDVQLQPMPVGVAGEIFIGGLGVVRGYFDRPSLTAERFVADPFSTEPGARMYKTGDLGRWRSDGMIDYLGRNDFQVKIRGYRIELGEIEARLGEHEQIKQAVVIAREDVAGDKRLVAYIIPLDAAPHVENLRSHLRAVLPEYMVPSAFVALDTLPLTPNGKVNRRALPAPELDAFGSRSYEAPSGAVETTLAAIWRELLHVERVGRDDNFFELGGHSLHGMKLIAKTEARFGVGLSMVAVFQFPTIRQMAQAVEQRRSESSLAAREESPEFEEGLL